MNNKNKENSAKKLRIIRFGGVLIFIGTFIFAFIFTGNDFFLRRCLASGNSVKYCNDIYDDRNLAFQKEKEFIEKELIVKKFDLESKNLLFRGEIYKNGNSYFGQFLNNKPDGFGKLIDANGDKYIGQWKNGEMNGQGTYIWGPNSKKSGDKYIGQWENGEKSGFGKLISSDGEIYIGEFLNNKKNGQGISISPGKEKKFGEWKNGKKI